MPLLRKNVIITIYTKKYERIAPPAKAAVRYALDLIMANSVAASKPKDGKSWERWVKLGVSLLSPLYCVIIIWLSYHSIFYEMIVLNPKSICVMLSAVSVIALVIMLYTRRQVLTILTSLVMLPALLPAVLMYFGEWHVLIPLLVVSLIVFFFSGLGETAKTVFGTIFVLLYLLGSLVYFLFTTLFAPSTISTTIETGVSPSGAYRYEVVNTVDSSDGSTAVIIESNTLDKNYDLLLFQIRGLTRTVVQARPLQESTVIEWRTEKRSDITAQISAISADITATLSEAQMNLLGRPAYEVIYGSGQTVTMSSDEYHAYTVQLSAADMEALETDKESYALDSLSENALELLGITVNDLRTVPLSELSDEDLAALGIPEEGDVMYCNGKVVFRYYIAILEEYFDLSNQEIGLT